MEQNVPAWKRIGLKVKDEIEYDPLSVVGHLDGANITNKQAKKINKEKRKRADVGQESAKRPPKRIKLPKGERPAPPERDQLAYLRQYDEDTEGWKFSKQKQNWILKNIENIPSEYEDALKKYLEGLQGASRERLVVQLKTVIDKWNDIMRKTEASIEKELEGSENSEDKRELLEKTSDPKLTENTEEKPTYDYVLRCRLLITALLDKKFELIGIDSLSEDKSSDTETLIPELEPHSTSLNDAATVEDLRDNLIIEEAEVENMTSSDEETQNKTLEIIATDDAEAVPGELTRKDKKRKREKKEKKEKKKKKKQKGKEKKGG
ncbi:uncharacterized protein PRCAT00004609001 [Priceomyces carsonii]|uniref:uncharacterized protein n=1 Tax=Priceomyces carsonii TaxID=28549 RepID=UPI002ED7BA31|nr:unnamed protein product [Priceomyces carsonii]